MFIEVVIRDCQTVLKQGKLNPPLDKRRSRTCRVILSLLFFHRKANSLPWVCHTAVSGTERQTWKKTLY